VQSYPLGFGQQAKFLFACEVKKDKSVLRRALR
jgi:hypothetical protein